MVIYLKDIKHDETVVVGEYIEHITSMYADGKKYMEITSNE